MFQNKICVNTLLERAMLSCIFSQCPQKVIFKNLQNTIPGAVGSSFSSREWLLSSVLLLGVVGVVGTVPEKTLYQSYYLP